MGRVEARPGRGAGCGSAPRFQATARPPELLANLRRVFGAPLTAPAPLPGDPGPPEPPTLISLSPRISFLHLKFRSRTPNFFQSFRPLLSLPDRPLFPISSRTPTPFFPQVPDSLPNPGAFSAPISVPPAPAAPLLSPLQAQNPHLSQGPPQDPLLPRPCWIS